MALAPYLISEGILILDPASAVLVHVSTLEVPVSDDQVGMEDSLCVPGQVSAVPLVIR